MKARLDVGGFLLTVGLEKRIAIFLPGNVQRSASSHLPITTTNYSSTILRPPYTELV
jgi:hypothetical protein